MKILKFIAVLLAAIITILVALLYEGDIPKDVVDARYTNPDSQFADFGAAGRIHYRDQGNRRSPPVVLLHGSNASLHTFEPWVRELEDQFRIITIDLPGHGLTGEVPSDNYSRQAMVNTVEQITDSLGLDDFALGGNSMGGAVAWRYALKHPEKVNALILINSAGGSAASDDESQTDSQLWAFSLLRQPWFRFFAEKIDPYHLITQGLRAAYNHSSVVNEALIMRYNDLTLRSGTRHAIVTRFAQYQPDTDRRSAEAISSLTQPTLIMWGKEDAVIPFAFSSWFESRLSHTTTAYYDGVGHIPMEEIPQRSARDLADFLTKQRSSAEKPPAVITPEQSDTDAS